MIDYHNKVFRSVSNTANGEVSAQTLFWYQQTGTIVTATYRGGGIQIGHLLATVDENGELDMRYHHLNDAGVLMTGICQSIPEVQSNGLLRLHEKWQWTSGDKSSGESVIEEILL